MKRAALLAVVIVGLLGGLAAAQCDCAAGTDVERPPCYTAFWSGEQVRFKLVVPADYFFCCPDCETPLITGWRVEMLDGAILYEATFDLPKGHWYVISWDQKDAWGSSVSEGYYKVVVATTSAGEFVNYIKVTPCCWGWGGCCWPRLSSCPCGIVIGQPYVKIFRPDRCLPTRCAPLSITIQGVRGQRSKGSGLVFCITPAGILKYRTTA